MKALLAAAEQGEIRPLPAAKSGIDTAITLGALEAALADMAINLSALDDVQPGDGDWKRYLAGDRAVFARRLADTIDEHGGGPHHHAVSRRQAIPRSGGRLSGRIRKPCWRGRAKATWRRLADLHAAVGGYRQGLSRHRICC